MSVKRGDVAHSNQGPSLPSAGSLRRLVESEQEQWRKTENLLRNKLANIVLSDAELHSSLARLADGIAWYSALNGECEAARCWIHKAAEHYSSALRLDRNDPQGPLGGIHGSGYVEYALTAAVLSGSSEMRFEVAQAVSEKSNRYHDIPPQRKFVRALKFLLLSAPIPDLGYIGGVKYFYAPAVKVVVAIAQRNAKDAETAMAELLLRYPQTVKDSSLRDYEKLTCPPAIALTRIANELGLSVQMPTDYASKCFLDEQ